MHSEGLSKGPCLPPPPYTASQQHLHNNLKKLNKVWVAQQAATIPNAVAGDEAKHYNGIKYERKRNGPFEGTLVSQPQLRRSCQ